MKRFQLSIASLFLLSLSPIASGGEPMVYIDAVIAEIELGRGLRSAEDLLRELIELDADPDAEKEGEAVHILPSKPARDGADPLREHIKALEGSKSFTVLSRPFVFTRDGEDANISSGQRVPVPPAEGDDGAVEAFDVGLTLDVTPTLIRKGEVVELDIKYGHDRVTGYSEVDGRQKPTISTEQLKSKLRVPDGAIALFGGPVTKRPTDRPLLAAVPGVKRVAGKRQGRFQTWIFLRPRIVKTFEEAKLTPAAGAEVEGGAGADETSSVETGRAARWGRARRG